MSLALYQMETDTYQCQRKLFDLLCTVSRVLHETRHAADGKDIRLSVRLDGLPVASDDRFLVVGEELLSLTMARRGGGKVPGTRRLACPWECAQPLPRPSGR